MEKGVVKIGKKEYQTVAKRLSDFRKLCPISEGWSVITHMTHYNDVQVVFRAEIYDPERTLVASGTAQEFWDEDKIHRTSSVEVCETSAVGRALAFCGLGGEEIATADEMISAIDAQNREKGWISPLEPMEDAIGGTYTPPEMPSAITSADLTKDGEEAHLLEKMKETARNNADKLVNLMGEDKYITWHTAALDTLCLVPPPGNLDDVCSLDGLTLFVDGQNNKIKENENG